MTTSLAFGQSEEVCPDKPLVDVEFLDGLYKDPCIKEKLPTFNPSKKFDKISLSIDPYKLKFDPDMLTAKPDVTINMSVLTGSSLMQMHHQRLVYCSCLENNDKLMMTGMNEQSKEKLKDWKKENLRANKQRLDEIYAGLNYETNFQLQRFRMDKTFNNTSCLPENMGKEFNDALVARKLPEAEFSVDRDTEKINAKWEKDFKGEKPQIVEEELSKALGDVPLSDELIPKKGLVFETKSRNSGRLVTSYGDSRSQVNVAFGLCESGTGSESENLIKAADFFKEHPQLLKSTDMKTLQKYKFGGCDLNSYEKDLIAYINKEFKFKAQYSTKYRNEALGISEQDKVATKGFAEIQSRIDDKIKASYKPIKNACIDYDTYKTQASAPTEVELQKISALETFGPEEILKDSDLSRFMSHNPILAKMLVNPTKRKSVGAALKNYASQTLKKGLAGTAALDAYLSFMRSSEISDLNKDQGIFDNTNCALLAKSYAALNADELPLRNFNEGATAFEKVSNNLAVCKIYKRPEEEIMPEMSKIIDANSLFAILQLNKNVLRTPDKDEDYLRFLEQRCDGFVGPSDSELAKLPNDEARAKLINKLAKKFVDSKSELKEMVSVIGSKTREISARSLTKATSADRQDSRSTREYNSTVKAIVDARPIKSVEKIYEASPSSEKSDASDKSPIAQAIESAQNKVDKPYIDRTIAPVIASANPQVQLPTQAQTQIAPATKAVVQSSGLEGFVGQTQLALPEKVVKAPVGRVEPESDYEIYTPLATTHKNTIGEQIVATPIESQKVATSVEDGPKNDNHVVAGASARLNTNDGQAYGASNSSNGHSQPSQGGESFSGMAAPSGGKTVGLSQLKSINRDVINAPLLDNNGVKDAAQVQQGVSGTDSQKLNGRGDLEVATVLEISTQKDFDVLRSGDKVKGESSSLEKYLKEQRSKNNLTFPSEIAISCVECDANANTMFFHIDIDKKTNAIIIKKVARSTTVVIPQEVRKFTLDGLKRENSNLQTRAPASLPTSHHRPIGHVPRQDVQ